LKENKLFFEKKKNEKSSLTANYKTVRETKVKVNREAKKDGNRESP